MSLFCWWGKVQLQTIQRTEKQFHKSNRNSFKIKTLSFFNVEYIIIYIGHLFYVLFALICISLRPLVFNVYWLETYSPTHLSLLVDQKHKHTHPINTSTNKHTSPNKTSNPNKTEHTPKQTHRQYKHTHTHIYIYTQTHTQIHKHTHTYTYTNTRYILDMLASCLHLRMVVWMQDVV